MKNNTRKKTKRLFLRIIMGLLLMFSLTPVVAWAAEPTFTNLVVFCRFADESEFVDTQYDGATVWQIVDNTYNGSVYSVADYFATVSDGKMQLQTLYLFADDGGSLVLDKKRGYYAQRDNLNPDGYEDGSGSLRMAELRQDWAAAVNRAIAAGSKPVDATGKEHSFAELDRDANGEIDLITIIYKNTTQNLSVEWSDPLWDYQTYYNGVELADGGKTLTSGQYLQLTCNYENVNGSLLYKGTDKLPILGTQGKICHETMHALGLKDLYKGDNSNAVGYMSLMGKHDSPVGQYISVKEREALGWLDGNRLKALKKDGSYTLQQAALSGVVGYKVDLPGREKTLYVEYRRFDKAGNRYGSQDKELYGCKDGEKVKGRSLKSGLVCYLVNTGVRFPSNLNVSGTRWNMEVVSHNSNVGNCTQSAVAAGEYLEVWDGSGWVKLEVTTMTDNELSFSVTGLPTVTEKQPHQLGQFAAAELSATYGDTPDGQQVSSTTGVVKYSSSVPAVVSVDELTGALTINKAGEAVITAKVAEDDDYTEVSASYTVRVAKATPSGAPAYTAIVEDGKTLADAALSVEGGTFSVTGVVRWVDADGKTELAADTAVAANTEYSWLFVPNDADNYNTLTGKLTLWQKQEENKPGGGDGGSTGGDGGSTGGDNGTTGGDGGSSGGAPAGGGGGGGGGAVADKKQPEQEKTEAPAEEAPRDVREWTGFADVDEKVWYYAAVKYAYENRLMNGCGENTFAGDDAVTREQFVAVLWRVAGCPKTDAKLPGVPNGAWYAEAMSWAVAEGIVGGYGDGKLGVGDEITREQLAAMLMRYAAGKVENAGAQLEFADEMDVAAWAREAVIWCWERGILNGDGNRLRPQHTATRAELATMLMRYVAENGRA